MLDFTGSSYLMYSFVKNHVLHVSAKFGANILNQCLDINFYSFSKSRLNSCKKVGSQSKFYEVQTSRLRRWILTQWGDGDFLLDVDIFLIGKVARVLIILCCAFYFPRKRVTYVFGINFPQVLNPWPDLSIYFAKYGLCDQDKSSYLPDNIQPCVKGHTDGCACAKSRKYERGFLKEPGENEKIAESTFH